MDSLQAHLESIYGIDIAFDARPGVRGTKDAVPNLADSDFAYVSGPGALAQELQRLFDLTPKGSCIDDPSYGIDWDMIGTPVDPRVTVALAKAAIYQALQHPSFAGRFRVAWLDVQWRQSEPNALRCLGILECFGFEGIEYVRFGPFVAQWWLANNSGE